MTNVAMTNKVLVVEDDVDIRFLIELLLQPDPRLEICAEASTLDEALAAAATADPGLIILDHFIAGSVTGLDAAPLLRGRAPGAKILLFSSHDLSAEVARQPMVDGFLRKDHMEELLAMVWSLLSLDGVPGT